MISLGKTNKLEVEGCKNKSTQKDHQAWLGIFFWRRFELPPEKTFLHRLQV